jgi:hypothetical protein
MVIEISTEANDVSITDLEDLDGAQPDEEMDITEEPGMTRAT